MTPAGLCGVAVVGSYAYGGWGSGLQVIGVASPRAGARGHYDRAGRLGRAATPTWRMVGPAAGDLTCEPDGAGARGRMTPAAALRWWGGHGG